MADLRGSLVSLGLTWQDENRIDRVAPEHPSAETPCRIPHPVLCIAAQGRRGETCVFTGALCAIALAVLCSATPALAWSDPGVRHRLTGPQSADPADKGSSFLLTCLAPRPSSCARSLAQSLRYR
jgi:hypothetical protein